MKIKTTGLSILELKEKYPKLFYDQLWYKNETFTKEHPEAGEFDIVIEKVKINMTWKEQVESLQNDEIILHPAQYIEGIINHFNETGERLFKDWYIRTGTIDSDGRRVQVGDFDPRGLYVNYYWGDTRHAYIGLSAARKLPLKLNPIPNYSSTFNLVPFAIDTSDVKEKLRAFIKSLNDLDKTL